MSGIVGGIDIGSHSIKALILKGTEILGQGIGPTGRDPEARAIEIMRKATAEAGVPLDQLSHIVGTGYGRRTVPLCTSTVTEISCHARANHHLNHAIRTILDMGGQDCKTIRCDSHGNVSNFAMNDKCAAGTGRYLERVADTLEIPLEELGPRSLQIVVRPAPLRRFCAVFAQQEIIRLLRDGSYHVNDILAGACDSTVDRILQLMRKVGVEEAFAISGGLAKNVGIVTRLEERLHLKAYIAPQPQIMGALGAALFACDRALTARK